MPEAVYATFAPHVAHVLRHILDPIGLGADGPAEEYDSYVPGVIGLVQSRTAFEAAITAHLVRIETEAMGMAAAPAGATRAARALLGLREATTSPSGSLVTQAVNLDGLRCLWVFRRSDGLHVYEHAAYQREVDESGECCWWADAGEGRSGLFPTAGAAEREAYAAIAWLREWDVMSGLLVTARTAALAHFDAALREGRLADARAAYDGHQAAIDDHDVGATAFTLGCRLEEAGDAEGAEGYYRNAVTQNPGLVSYQQNLAALLFEAERYAEAKPLLEAIVRETTDAYELRATCLAWLDVIAGVERERTTGRGDL